MARYEVTEPFDVADRLLWRDAQRLLDRHREPDHKGRCVWCGGHWPCPPRQLAERAEVMSRRPWPDDWPAPEQDQGGDGGTGAPRPDTSRWSDLVDYASHPR